MKGINFFILISSLLVALTSCSLIEKNYEVDSDKLFIGAVGSVKDSYGTTFTNYLHLEISQNESIIKTVSVDLTSSTLQILGKNSYDENGNLINYFNAGNYLINEFDLVTLSSIFIDKKYELKVYFSLGELTNSDFDFISQKQVIDEAGIYCFSTLSKNNELLTYSHADVLKENIQWFTN